MKLKCAAHLNLQCAALCYKKLRASKPLDVAECSQFVILKAERSHNVLCLAASHWQQSLRTHTHSYVMLFAGEMGRCGGTRFQFLSMYALGMPLCSKAWLGNTCCSLPGPTVENITRHLRNCDRTS